MFALRKPTLQWLSLVGIIWLQSINGTNTNFPAYSSHLKASLSLSQLQLNNLAFASDAGKLFGNLAGVAAMILPFPAVLAGGSALGLVGYGLQYLSVAGHAPPLAYWQVFALTAVAGNSICWINTVSYAVIIGNFPAGLRQTAVGLATSYQGLSAKLYSDAARFLAGKPDRSYLLLNSVSPMAVSLATAPFVRIVNVGEGFKEARMESGFLVMFVITVMTGIYSVATSLGALGLHSSVSAIGTAVLMAAPISVPAGRAVWSNRRKVHSLTEESDGAVKVDGGGDAEVEGSGVIMEEVGAWGMVRRVDFWLYFWAYFGSVTVGLVYLNNLGQIADSRGCAATSSIVSLSSSFGFFGRLMPSLLDYHFSRSKHVISRPGMIAILAAPMAGAFFILLIPTDHALQVGTAIIGVCTGAITSISVSTTSELFGTRNFSVNHNVLVANIPIGSFLFGYLAAVFYNRERNEFADHNGNCMGMECYRISFVVWGCVSLIGTFLAFVLYVRTKKFYSQPRM